MRIEQLSSAGYTRGMKTAESIPDDVFRKAERLAHRMKKSRSELFSNALSEYVARHAPDHVTEAMDNACAEVGLGRDEFTSVATVSQVVAWDQTLLSEHVGRLSRSQLGLVLSGIDVVLGR